MCKMNFNSLFNQMILYTENISHTPLFIEN